MLVVWYMHLIARYCWRFMHADKNTIERIFFFLSIYLLYFIFFFSLFYFLHHSFELFIIIVIEGLINWAPLTVMKFIGK